MRLLFIQIQPELASVFVAAKVVVQIQREFRRFLGGAFFFQFKIEGQPVLVADLGRGLARRRLVHVQSAHVFIKAQVQIVHFSFGRRRDLRFGGNVFLVHIQIEGQLFGVGIAVGVAFQVQGQIGLFLAERLVGRFLLQGQIQVQLVLVGDRRGLARRRLVHVQSADVVVQTQVQIVHFGFGRRRDLGLGRSPFLVQVQIQSQFVGVGVPVRIAFEVHFQTEAQFVRFFGGFLLVQAQVEGQFVVPGFRRGFAQRFRVHLQPADLLVQPKVQVFHVPFRGRRNRRLGRCVSLFQIEVEGQLFGLSDVVRR